MKHKLKTHIDFSLKHFASITFLLVIFFLSSCKTVVDDPWYEEKKQEILAKTDLKPDSISIEQPPRGLLTKYYYKGSEIFKKEQFRNDTVLMTRTLYGPQSMELKTEFWPNGTLGFEGVALRDTFYGLSTWYHENGNTSLQGIRYKNAKIGTWYYWNKNGKLRKTEDFGEVHLIDSLQQTGK